MKRGAALIHTLEKLKREHPLDFEDIDINSVEIYIDVDNSEEIIPILIKNRNKFKLIILEILKGVYNNSLYRKEGGNVTAMKMKNIEFNSRVYCQEIAGTNGQKKKIVMARGFQNKTSEKNDKKNNPIIESIKKYEYEFFKNPKEADRYRKGI